MNPGLASLLVSIGHSKVDRWQVLIHQTPDSKILQSKKFQETRYDFTDDCRLRKLSPISSRILDK